MASLSECPNVRWCELFPRLESDGSLSHCLQEYCRAEYERCVRYQMSMQRIRPPKTLLPDGETIEESISDEH